MSALLAILRFPAIYAVFLALLVCSGCGPVTSRHVVTDNGSVTTQDTVAQPADVAEEPLGTTPTGEQPTSETQPLLFADERPEPYQPRGPPGLTFLPFFPAPLLLPADVVMPSELGVVVERVVRGNVVVAWAAISPVGWRVGWLAGPQAVGFRYYNPVTGRYISRDPIGYRDGPNVYLYVKNNPINRIDPLGLGEGHHVISKATWEGKDLKPGVKEIFDHTRLEDPDYVTHDTSKLPRNAPAGVRQVSAFGYNKAIIEHSTSMFGKLPHELDAKQASKLVDSVMKATLGEAENSAALKTIGYYNREVIKEINAARLLAGNKAMRLGRQVGGAIARGLGKVVKPVGLVTVGVGLAQAETRNEARRVIWDAVDPTFGLGEYVWENVSEPAGQAADTIIDAVGVPMARGYLNVMDKVTLGDMRRRQEQEAKDWHEQTQGNQGPDFPHRE